MHSRIKKALSEAVDFWLNQIGLAEKEIDNLKSLHCASVQQLKEFEVESPNEERLRDEDEGSLWDEIQIEELKKRRDNQDDN